MAVSNLHRRAQPPAWLPMHPVPAGTLAVVVLTKIADAYTTLAGLQSGLVEANPIAAAVIGLFGPVAGLFTTALVSLAVIIAGVEWLAIVAAEHDYDADAARFIAYLFPASLYGILTFRNLLLVYA